MANTDFLQLPVAIGLTGAEYVPLVQSGGDKRATVSQIANTATGFVPDTARVNAGLGLSGGGLLTSDPTLNFDPASLTVVTAMAVADSFPINSVAAGNLPRLATFPNAMKAIGGMTSLSIPDLASDGIPIYHAADGLTYKVSPSALGLAFGNVPAGGTTGQVLAKNSATNYDTAWINNSLTLDAYSIAANPTGAITTSVSLSGTAYQILRIGSTGLSLAFGSVDISQSAVVGSSILALANGGTNAALTASNGGIFYSTATAGAILSGTATAGQIVRSGLSSAPSWSTSTYPATSAAGTILASLTANTITATAAPTLGITGSVIGTLAFAGNTSGTATITPQATAGTPTLTLPNASGTFAVSVSAPLALSATTGNLTITGAAGTILAGSTPAFTATPVLGVPTSTLGTLGLAGNTSGTVTLSPAAAAGTWTLTLPTSGGSANQFLQTNGSGVATWATPSGAAIDLVVGATTVTSGTTTRVLYDNAGVLGEYTQVPLAVGGTNANLTASNGGIVYSTASALAILSGTATANQVLLSGLSTTPAWSTATYPATTTINQLLYSSSANVIAGLATVNGGILNAGATGIPALTVTPILGVAGTSTGTIGLSGVTSGVVTIQPQSVAGTFNFNLPTSAGSSGQALLSGGGVAAPMTWTTSTFPSTSAAGTILASLTANTITASATPVLGIAGSVLGTLTLSGNTSGTVLITPQATAGTVTLTLPNTTGTIAASATAPITLNTTTGAIGITAAALTKTDDTNVTLTLGGAPTTALLAATSITAGWTGQLALTRGGTNASLTASNGGLVYSDASALAILAGTATAGQIPRSGSSAAPSWSTSVYPATSAAGTILASLTANTITASSSPVLGAAGTATGTLGLSGTTSGTITVQPQAVAGTYNFNLPTTAGTAGQLLTSQGGGASAMTWTTVAGTGTVTSVDVSGGTTGLTTSGGPITTTGTITLAGTLAIANGGTNGTTATAGFDNLSPTTTRGDIIARGASNNVRLAIGGANTFLTSNGTDPSWAAAVTSITASNGVTSSTGSAITGTGTIYGGPMAAGGRLTLVTGTPVMATTQSAKTTIYWTPYLHNLVPIYDGTVVRAYTFAELSIVLGTNWAANTNFDVFLGNDAGTFRLCSVAWTNDTTRATALNLAQNGFYSNNAAFTARYNNTTTFTCPIYQGTYLGTFRTNGSTGTIDFIYGGSASGGVAGSFGVWNMYNRINLSTMVVDSGTSYTYAGSGVFRQSRASAGNQVSWVAGLAEDGVSIQYQNAINNGSGATGAIAIGYDTTTTYTGSFPPSSQTGIVLALVAFTAPGAALGYHYVAALDYSTGGTTTFENVSFGAAAFVVNLRL